MLSIGGPTQYGCVLGFAPSVQQFPSLMISWVINSTAPRTPREPLWKFQTARRANKKHKLRYKTYQSIPAAAVAFSSGAPQQAWRGGAQLQKILLHDQGLGDAVQRLTRSRCETRGLPHLRR
jgi:hypothetical protein